MPRRACLLKGPKCSDGGIAVPGTSALPRSLSRLAEVTGPSRSGREPSSSKASSRESPSYETKSGFEAPTDVLKLLKYMELDVLASEKRSGVICLDGSFLEPDSFGLGRFTDLGNLLHRGSRVDHCTDLLIGDTLKFGTRTGFDGVGAGTRGEHYADRSQQGCNSDVHGDSIRAYHEPSSVVLERLSPFAQPAWREIE